MNRRELLALAGAAALAWPLTARGPRAQPNRLHHIFWVSTETQPDPFLDGFREGLRARGYTEGGNVALTLRYAPGDPDALGVVISELRSARADLAVSSGPAIRAMATATGVPVLFAISGDPVELGLVKSLARPDSNFTGVTFLSLDLAGKRVELLTETFPGIRRLAVLSNTDHPGERSEWRATEQAMRTLGLDPVYVPFRGGRELDAALATLVGARPDAMLVFPEGVTMVQRGKLAGFAIAHRLPSMFGWSEYCDAGGLISYGANQREAYMRLATYADRIMRGESPASLPVEQPTKFELTVNRKTALAMGLEVPAAVISRADRVIE
jgi:putative ABC transport system substrate-binding protein